MHTLLPVFSTAPHTLCVCTKQVFAGINRPVCPKLGQVHAKMFNFFEQGRYFWSSKCPMYMVRQDFEDWAYNWKIKFSSKSCFSALFTVEAPQSLYTVEHGNNVTMECTFPVNGKLKFGDLSVSWEKKDKLKKQVYVLLKGEEDFKSQHSDFRGRIKLLKENLNLGQSLLQITDVKLRDAGFYRCLIGYGGADYKTINLRVKGE